LVWFVPIDHAGELNESAVPGILDDASVMIGDFGIENGISKSFQFRQSVFFVDPYQAARARDIRRQNSCQSPLYVIAAQGAPPGLGEIEYLHSRIAGRCPAMLMSETGPACVKTCPSRECAELFSLFSSFDGDRQGGSFVIERNRDKRQTRKSSWPTPTSALPLKADIRRAGWHVRSVPTMDIAACPNNVGYYPRRKAH
jgi:hypothetical protein